MSKRCGNEQCGASTFIDEVTTTHGWGELDQLGVWEHMCPVCNKHEFNTNPEAVDFSPVINDQTEKK